MIKKLRITTIFIAALTVVGIAVYTGAARAEDKGAQDTHELAKQSRTRSAP